MPRLLSKIRHFVLFHLAKVSCAYLVFILFRMSTHGVMGKRDFEPNAGFVAFVSGENGQLSFFLTLKKKRIFLMKTAF